MRRRRVGKFKSLDEDYSIQEEEEEEHFDPEKAVGKLLGKQKKPTKKKKTTTSKREKHEQDDEESSVSQILEIRDGDEQMREHIRPDFLRRWDGISNELELYEEELQDMSPMFQVYWPVKCRNMKAVVFLQFGKMEYFVFENDALLLSELTKKKIKHWSKFIMCNFWCKEVQAVKRDLYERRIPVLVMKQIEDQEYRLKNGLVRRQVQEVITPAIHPLFVSETAARERLLLALFRHEGAFGFVLLDSETNDFLVEEVADDKYLHEVRRTMNRHRPVQLLIPREGHDQIAQIARQISNPHTVVLNLINNEDKTATFLRQIAEETNAPLLKKLRKMCEEEGAIGQQFSRFRSVMALSLVWQYLSELSLREKIFNQGLFSEGNQESFRAPFFDSQVYENLEIFRVKQAEDETYCQPGTLLHYVDNCRTQQGRKLLHRWLDCPPAMLQDVLQRQQAVRELVQNATALKYHDRMVGFEKLGRRLGDIYHWIERNSQRGKNILTKYINFEKEYDPSKNPAVIRIRQMVDIVKCLKQYENFLKELGSCGLKASLLAKNILLQQIQNLHTMEWQNIDELKGLPEISYVAEAILRIVVYDELTGNLEPVPGELETFDENKREFERIQNALEEQLIKWREFFNCSKIQYVSIRAKNEIQVPKSAIKKDGKTHPHPDLMFSSEIAGAVRYTTAQTLALSMELSQYEEAMAQSYEPLLQRLLAQFSRFRGLWDRYVQSSAWIDALMSLAQASKRMGLRCLPVFRQKGISIKSAIHPSLSQILEKIVSNDLELKDDQKVLLLTGPNMGGKSTLLKQTCLLVILAQLGCYVPAKEYCAPVFDQIFCRIGASDRIYEGKSTFYVELQETKRIISKATENSLVVIDQLGRGTSTFDGMAIAQSVLDHLIQDIQPVTLFSTHYTQISERFKANKAVRLAKMSHQICEDSLVFTYQLQEGVAQKSFANNVARMVGIKQEIIKRSQQKSDEMHHQTNKKKILREICTFAGVQSLKDHIQSLAIESNNGSLTGWKKNVIQNSTSKISSKTFEKNHIPKS